MKVSAFAVLLTSALSLPSEPSEITLPISRKQELRSKLSPLQQAQKSIIHTFNKYASHQSLPRYNHVFASSVPLDNARNLLYVCNVTVGNGQVLSMDLDTGSADTWVRGKGCKSSDGSCDDLFQHVDVTDPTLTKTGKAYSVQYGSGSVRGDIYTAPVSIGGATATYPIGISTEENGFSDGYEAGLLGMGFNSISQIGKATGKNANFFDGLGYSGDKNMFSFYFSNFPSDNGELTLGGYNSDRFTGPITWVPLNSQTYFQFDVKSWTFKAGSTTGSLKPGGFGGFFGGNAIAGKKRNFSFNLYILDTGSTLLLFNDGKVADAINQAIGAEPFESKLGVYPIKCSIAKTGTPLVLNYGSVPFTIPPSIYVIDNLDGNCFSGVSQFTQFGGPSIFGDIFLRAYYSIYDKTEKRVGFAQAVHPI
jgi:hypothetical protein